MALQAYSAASSTSMMQNGSVSHQWMGIITNKQVTMVYVARKGRVVQGMGLPRFRASFEPIAIAAGQVAEVNIHTFWPTIEAAGGKAVVLDMYTQWCGPCKMMAPKFQQLSKKYQDVVFLKLDCDQHNRPLAKELGIKVVPTFKIFKDSKIVREVMGAKFDDLVVAIEHARGLAP